MISLRDVVVPITNPSTATIVMKMFLNTMKHLAKPVEVFQKTQVWIKAGKARPNDK